VIRHTVTFNRLDIVWLDYLAWLVLDADLAAVQVSQNEAHSCEGLEESDLLLY
jgi:hypothetical protein